MPCLLSLGPVGVCGIDCTSQCVDPTGHSDYAWYVPRSAPASPDFRVAIRSLEPLLATVEGYGQRIEPLLCVAGISARERAEPDLRIPVGAVDAVWQAAQELCGDALLGLRVADQLAPSSFDVFGYTVAHSPTWGLGLRRVIKYFRMLSDASSYRLQRGPQAARLSYHRHASSPGPCRPLAEFNLAVVHAYGRRLLADQWRVQSVHFRHACSGDIAGYALFFGVEPQFEARESAIEFDRQLLDARVESADPKLGAILEDVAMAALQRLPAVDDWPGRVRAFLAPRLTKVVAQGLPQKAEAAQALGLGTRTLQRRLSEAGTSFQALMTEIRLELAAEHLASGQLSIAEIAFVLGYSDSAAFHRAFRRVYETTPAHYRAQHTSS